MCIKAAAPALWALKQKGKKEGGLGEGIFALLQIKIERFRFSLIKRNTKQKNFLFLLPARRSLGAGGKEKIAREKIKKCRENFSVLVCRREAEASGNAPHSCSGFSLKKVRISFRIRSQVGRSFWRLATDRWFSCLLYAGYRL